MKKILAISGGVDSMVLLDIFAKKFSRDEIVVATFDHGTRESSKTDADFVEKLSRNRYALQKIYRGEKKLGAGISEEKARLERYEFLRKIAFSEKGEIFTAHHLDDLVETVVINFTRGTGFRGLASISALGIRRPFIDGFFDDLFDKRRILKYAAEHDITFREDPTNASDDYLRNRIRTRTFDLPLTQKMEIFKLWQTQKEIVREIDEILDEILPENLEFSRGDFKEFDEKTSMEILRAGLLRAGTSATRPQLHDFLCAIQNYEPGKYFNLPNDKLVKLNKKTFML